MKFSNKILIFFILIILKTTAFTQIILIEGSPRSGKTTAATILNEQLPNSERFSVDEYIHDDDYDIEGQNKIEMHRNMNECLERGITVICDTNGDLRYYEECFPSFDIFSVLLFCPPLEIINRTATENKRAAETQNDFERNTPDVIDLFIDRYECTPEKNKYSLCSLSVGTITNIMLTLGSDPDEGEDVCKAAVKLARWAFRNRREENVFIQPRAKIIRYANLIIDTTKYNPRQCGNIIKIFYNKWLEQDISNDFQHIFN